MTKAAREVFNAGKEKRFMIIIMISGKTMHHMEILYSREIMVRVACVCAEYSNCQCLIFISTIGF